MNELAKLKKEIKYNFGSVPKFERANNLEPDKVRSFLNSKPKKVNQQKVDEYRALITLKKEDPNLISDSDIYFVREAILKKYKTVDKFCKECGFSQSELSQFLKGRRKIKSNKYYEILEALS